LKRRELSAAGLQLINRATNSRADVNTLRKEMVNVQNYKKTISFKGTENTF